MKKISDKIRNKLMLTGLYLSKFDRKGLEKLNFSTFTEAFNVLGYALEGSPASIKNYRDEFDPYFENSRQGWHGREMREHCKEVFDKYADLQFDEFSKIICSFLVKDFVAQIEVDKILNVKRENSFVSRLSTGLAAENYFMANYKKHFKEFSLLDTRTLGCGFDFKMNSSNNFCCVEVKGLNLNKGNFLITQKEFDVASQLKDRYCLYIVRNFCDAPREEIFFNPLEHFELKKMSSQIIQVSYQGAIA